MRLERREDGTTHSELLTLGEWLLAEHCPIVAMESTGVYWRPVYHLLCGLVGPTGGKLR
jgi:transposase